IDWQYHRFPGRESQVVRSVLNRHPNHYGIFELESIDPSLKSLNVEWRVEDEVYLFTYAIHDDNTGVDLTDVIYKTR
ncbi:MAG: hypothetical protein AAF085_16185, partial [Planctomycetota bacterium]